MRVVQMGVVQMGVVQLGSVQMGVDHVPCCGTSHVGGLIEAASNKQIFDSARNHIKMATNKTKVVKKILFSNILVS